MSECLATFKGGVCSRCGRKSVRRGEPQAAVKAGIDDVCIGCDMLTHECGCPNILGRLPPMEIGI